VCVRTNFRVKISVVIFYMNLANYETFLLEMRTVHSVVLELFRVELCTVLMSGAMLLAHVYFAFQKVIC
jgi:hypothetical protein